MEANAKKPKTKADPKLNPTENAALKRLEHDLITEDGIVPATKGRHAIHCLTVIGTIEGHTLSPDAQKTTKYEHVIPQLVDIEEDPEVEGLLVILNTVGGDVEAGLALAELIAGVSKPSATLVLGGGHSIGIPLAVAARHSFIVPTATMTVHPVRHSGMVLGVPQTLRYFEQMQERIVSFVAEHSKITARRFTQLMHNTGELVMDMGTVLDGRQAVEEGLIDERGGLRDALGYLYKEIEKGRRTGGAPPVIADARPPPRKARRLSRGLCLRKKAPHEVGSWPSLRGLRGSACPPLSETLPQNLLQSTILYAI